MGVGLADWIAEFFEQAQGILQVGACLVEEVDPGASMTDAQVSVGLSRLVAVVLGGDQGGVVGGGEVVPVALPFEEWHQRMSELPGVRVVSGGGGQLDRRQQHGIFSGKPGPRRRVIGGFLWCHPGQRWGQGNGLLLVGVGQIPSSLRGVQVVIQHPL